MLKDKMEKLLPEYNYNNVKFVEYGYDDEDFEKIIEYLYSGINENGEDVEISICFDGESWCLWDKVADGDWWFIDDYVI